MAKIFCFSGTGNSLYAARKIAAEIDAEVCNMRTPADCDDDVIGFVFPTYFWGLPRSVDSFLDNLVITNKSAYIFSVTVYGGFSSGVNGAVDKLLKKQGLKLSYGAKVRMVENYLPGFKVNDSDELWKRSDSALDAIILDLKNRVRKSAGAYTVFNKIAQKAYPANNGNCAENFTVNGCKSCGLCEKVCPNGNITLENGAPKFGGKCDLCLGCLNVCPADAIDFGKSTRGKKRYKNRRITAQELVEFNSKK
ncbi:MAG: EFR1 family ferrodoxin [Oscillospiraceae bacterium]|nr:EFR1 family ferrodoxin [Oscillospiraceae bacterium]